jgi:hypothetical protein
MTIAVPINLVQIHRSRRRKISVRDVDVKPRRKIQPRKLRGKFGWIRRGNCRNDNTHTYIIAFFAKIHAQYHEIRPIKSILRKTLAIKKFMLYNELVQTQYSRFSRAAFCNTDGQPRKLQSASFCILGLNSRVAVLF